MQYNCLEKKNKSQSITLNLSLPKYNREGNYEYCIMDFHMEVKLTDLEVGRRLSQFSSVTLVRGE